VRCCWFCPGNQKCAHKISALDDVDGMAREVLFLDKLNQLLFARTHFISGIFKHDFNATLTFDSYINGSHYQFYLKVVYQAAENNETT
jgi:hypothetical protein